MILIGVDCATKPVKVGLALGEYGAGGLELRHVKICSEKYPPAEVLCAWLKGRSGSALLAFDSHLGWPEPMGTALSSHIAGRELGVEANEMFSRTTDRHIHARLQGHPPLDVGADKIARTAHATLRVIGQLRQRLGEPIPLAWSRSDVTTLSAIEVYPAATLKAHGIQSLDYKKPIQLEIRREMANSLILKSGLRNLAGDFGESDHTLDAVVCLVAAKDFFDGCATPPGEADRAAAEKEGWIWTLDPHACS